MIDRSRRALAEKSAIVASALRRMSFHVYPSTNAGLSLWLRATAGSTDRLVQPRLTLHDCLGAAKVHLARGERFGAEEKAWFRLTISHDMEYLREGLQRIAKALQMMGIHVGSAEEVTA